MQRQGIIRTGFLFCFLFPLFAFANLGSYTRYIADDYCTASRSLSEGVIGSALWWYNNWAGQITNWTLKGIVGIIGSGVASVFPILIIGVGLIALAWMQHELSLTLNLAWNRYDVLLLATVMIYSLFDGIPSITQSLYWLGASIPYTTPVILLIFLGAFCLRILRQSARKPPGIAAFTVVVLVPLVAGGLSEVYAVFQGALFGLSVLGCLFLAPHNIKRAALPFLVVGFVSSLMAIAVIALAPGNAARQSMFAHSISLPELAVQTVVVASGYIVLALGVFSPLPLLTTLVVSAMLAYRFRPRAIQLTQRDLRKWMVLSAGIALVLIMSCLAAPLYGLGTAPSSRAYILPQFVLVCTAAIWGTLMGHGLRRPMRPLAFPLKLAGFIGLTALLIAGPLASTWQSLAQVADYRAFAEEWDARDKAIRDAVRQGEHHLVVNTLNNDLGSLAQLDVIGPDATEWVNQCAAQYYGLESLTARTPFQMASKATQ
jgi:hypothetical protein